MITDNIKKNRIALIITIIFTIAGLLLTNLIDQFDYSGFVVGFGSSLSAVFAFRLFRNIKHPELIEQENIDNADERNQIINGKAGFANFRVASILITIQLVIYYFLRMPIPLAISFVVLGLNFISFAILRNHYEKKM